MERATYLVADSRLDELRALLVREGCTLLAETEATLVFFDTADWALWRARVVLTELPAGGVSCEPTKTPFAGHALQEDSLNQLRDRLSPAALPTDVRERLRLPLRRESWARDQLQVSLLVSTAPGSTHSWLSHEAQDEPNKRNSAARAPARLTGDEWAQLLTPIKEPLNAAILRRAAESQGAMLPQPPRKTAYTIDEEAGVVQAARSVIGHQLSVLQYHELGTRLGIEVEALHDFRIALRRLRSAVALFGALLPEAFVATMTRELRWVSGPTSLVRDFDVQLMALPGYAGTMGNAGPFFEQQMRRALQAGRSRARRDLLRTLDTRRYARLLQRLGRFAEGSRRGASPPPLRPAAQMLLGQSRLILEKRARKLSKGAPDEAYHDLRKALKRYRYSCEFLRSLYGKALDHHIRTMDKLQLRLGEFQDAVVAMDLLQEGRVRFPLNDRRSRDALFRTGERVALLRGELQQSRKRIRREVRQFLRKKPPF